MKNTSLVGGLIAIIIPIACYLFISKVVYKEPVKTIRYCMEPGCPQEITIWDDDPTVYCIYHECSNYSCHKRRFADYSYCETCLKRAIQQK